MNINNFSGLLTLSICVSVQADSSYAYTQIDYPHAQLTLASDIDGSNIVGRYGDGTMHGFKYDGTNWTSIDYPGNNDTYATGFEHLGDDLTGVQATWAKGDLANFKGPDRKTAFQNAKRQPLCVLGQMIGETGNQAAT